MRGLRLGVGMVLATVTAAAHPVEVEVAGLGIDMSVGSPVIRLVEKGGGRGSDRRELPIWIGPAEAQAIVLEMQGLPPPRPLTHDLMKQLVERLGGSLRRVVIEELRDGTYYATLHLDAPGGKALKVDARPSDAIAFALRVHAQILVEDALFEAAATLSPPAPAHLWGLTLQDLTPEMAVFFAVDGREGVLVSDVAAAAPARKLARGDVITALDGESVHSVTDLRGRAAARPESTPVRLSVSRNGADLEVEFAAEKPGRKGGPPAE
jgi:uncharacterized protein